MTRTLRISLRLLTASLLTTTLGASPILAAPQPPKSDGSSGSFDAQFGNGQYGGATLVAFDTDNGDVIEYVGGGDTVAFTIPHETITYNGRSVPAYEFSSFNVEPTVSLTIQGTAPAVFLSQGNMTIAGQFKFANTPIAGGTPSTGVSGNYDGGQGAGVGGGGGGEGPGGGASACVSVSFTGSGGGGGGNYSIGQHGLKNYEPSDAGNQVDYPGGLAGRAESTSKLQGGGGGGAPGGGNANGEYWAGAPGGSGGGAVAFSTQGTITITSSGVLDVSGGAGATNDGSGNPGNSGGGAAGDQWFFAKGGLTNAGQILLHGGAGGAYKAPKTACGSQQQVPGPNGGYGSGGVLIITAPTIANSGTINLSSGNGTSAPSGGLLDANGVTISNTGTIEGARTTE